MIEQSFNMSVVIWYHFMLSGEECEFYVDSVACDIDCKIALSYDCVQGK